MQNRPGLQRFHHDPVTVPRGEGAIAIAYDRPIDQALKSHKRMSRIVSAVIVVLGLGILAVVLLTGDRQRERAAVGILPGDDSTAVKRLMGDPPHRCEPSSLAHLADRFPDMPRPTVEQEIARLRAGTAARWLYPEGAGCVPARGDTEIGLDRDGHVLWIVPLTGRRPIVYLDAPS